MKNRNNLRKIALLAGAALLSTSALAAPMDIAVTRTETVKYSVADASTTEGAAALYQKLHETAAHVCGETDAAAPWLYTADSYQSCVSDALDKAVQRVGIPLVSALHLQGSTGDKLASMKKPQAGKLETIASR